MHQNLLFSKHYFHSLQYYYAYYANQQLSYIMHGMDKTLKQKIIDFYGHGIAADAARFIGMKPTTIRMWPDTPNAVQINQVIAGLYRKRIPVPEWLLK